jgi:trehalose-6-phosphate synthase
MTSCFVYSFADKVVEHLSPDYDFVWVHDYHLMLLPDVPSQAVQHGSVRVLSALPVPVV